MKRLRDAWKIVKFDVNDSARTAIAEKVLPSFLKERSKRLRQRATAGQRRSIGVNSLDRELYTRVNQRRYYPYTFRENLVWGRLDFDYTRKKLANRYGKVLDWTPRPMFSWDKHETRVQRFDQRILRLLKRGETKLRPSIPAEIARVDYEDRLNEATLLVKIRQQRDSLREQAEKPAIPEDPDEPRFSYETNERFLAIERERLKRQNEAMTEVLRSFVESEQKHVQQVIERQEQDKTRQVEREKRLNEKMAAIKARLDASYLKFEEKTKPRQMVLDQRVANSEQVIKQLEDKDAERVRKKEVWFFEKESRVAEVEDAVASLQEALEADNAARAEAETEEEEKEEEKEKKKPQKLFSVADAMKILGLSKPFSREELRKAVETLKALNDPEKFGSKYLRDAAVYAGKRLDFALKNREEIPTLAETPATPAAEGSSKPGAGSQSQHQSQAPEQQQPPSQSPEGQQQPQQQQPTHEEKPTDQPQSDSKSENPSSSDNKAT